MLPTWWMRLVEFGFRLLYNELAWTYDAVSWAVSLGHWRKWQLVSLDFLRGPRVLEIAHGPGHMLAELQRRGYQVVGCDLSARMGRLAQARLRRQGRPPLPFLVRCRVPDVPFPGRSFDGILSQFPTRFMTEPGTMAALFHLLRPGGVLVVLPEGHLTGRGPLLRLIHWLFAITGQSIGSPEGDPLAPTAVEELWRDQLQRAGFEARIEMVALEDSACTIIIASRPG